MLGEAAFAAINLAMPFVIINFALADLIGQAKRDQLVDEIVSGMEGLIQVAVLAFIPTAIIQLRRKIVKA